MGSSTAVEFQVMEGNVIGRPTFCGAAQVSVEALLGDPTASESLCASASGGTLTGPVMDLELRLPSDEDAYGKMDPFTVVSFVEGDGARKEISRTRTDWNADLHPHWDHTCRGQPFKMGSSTAVEFQVMEGNVIGRPTFCGAAQVSVEALLGDPTASESLCASASGGTLTGPVMDMELRLPSDEASEKEMPRPRATDYRPACRILQASETNPPG